MPKAPKLHPWRSARSVSKISCLVTAEQWHKAVRILLAAGTFASRLRTSQRISSALRVAVAVFGDPAELWLENQSRDGFPNAALCVAAARCTTHGKGRLSLHSTVQVSHKTVEDTIGCDVLFGKAGLKGLEARSRIGLECGPHGTKPSAICDDLVIPGVQRYEARTRDLQD
jgi:hypothetical protein